MFLTNNDYFYREISLFDEKWKNEIIRLDMKAVWDKTPLPKM